MSKLRRDDIGLFIDSNIDVQGRSLVVHGEVDSEMLLLVTKGLHLLNRSRIGEDILIYLNSEGGDPVSGLGICDLIRASKSPVTVCVTGEACSMAAVIVQSAHHRQITSSSFLMIHQGETGMAEAHRRNVKSFMKMSDKIDERCDKLLLSRIQEKVPSYSWTKLTNVLDFDTYLTAEEAFKWGLVDEII